MKFPDTPEKFFKIIPTDPKENIGFRIKLHQELAIDEGFRKVFLSFCKDYKPIIFNTTF